MFSEQAAQRSSCQKCRSLESNTSPKVSSAQLHRKQCQLRQKETLPTHFFHRSNTERSQIQQIFCLKFSDKEILMINQKSDTFITLASFFKQLAYSFFHMKNTFLARPHCLISTGNKWSKDIMFSSTAQHQKPHEF